MLKKNKRPIEAALGIDVGGTFAKVALVSPQGGILSQAQIATQAELGPEFFVDSLSNLLSSWLKEKSWKITGAGLALAGDVDSEQGLLRFAPNLKAWTGFPIKQALQHRLKVSVVVDNDANLAVWGGYVMELKRKPRNVIGVTLGTGVGGGIVLNGALYRGSTGSAGEVGHMRVESEHGELCHCGNSGCLEAYAGSYGIVRTAKKILAQKNPSLLRDHPIDPELITRAARDGDPIAKEVWARTAFYLSTGLSNLVMLYNPDTILLLGGISRAGEQLMKPLRQFFKRQPFKTPFATVTLRAAHNPNGGCVGAALLALEAEKLAL